MPTPREMKAFDKALTRVATAQQMLIKLQTDIDRQQHENAVNHARMMVTAQQIQYEETPWGDYWGSRAEVARAIQERTATTDAWLRGTERLVRLRTQEPKLIQALLQAQKRLDQALKDLG